jgi:hypothetical protein
MCGCLLAIGVIILAASIGCWSAVGVIIIVAIVLGLLSDN